MRIAAIVWCAAIAGLQVYLFRRIREDLYKNHLDGPKGFRALLAPWTLSGWCRITGDEIHFWNGSAIYLCHCKDEKDRFKYQGAEIHVLLIDELTHFTDIIYRFLRNRVRMVGVKLPVEQRGRFPRILCAANPGNVGHQFVKETFIAGAPPLTIRRMPESEGGMLRQYIPARLEDNPSMLADDPGYEARLQGLGSATLVAAMRRGDWDVVEGAFFGEWSNEQHVIAPFAIPDTWLRFRSGDWGSYAPFSIGWWAVVGDDFKLPDKRILPRGALVRYREWYGKVGGKLTAEQVGKGIVEREASDLQKLTYGVLDPAAFNEDGGPSIAERINNELIAAKLIGFHKADNARVARQSGDAAKAGPMGGWDQMRARLVGSAERGNDGSVLWSTGRPMIYCFSTCVDSIRTIPILQHDKSRAEDLDTNAEDHSADEWRYASMSRPWVKVIAPPMPSRNDTYSAQSERYSDSIVTL